MAKQAKSGNEVKRGDRLSNFIDGGFIGDVVDVRPYTGPLLDLLGAGTQIGEFAGGWAMTLPAKSSYAVEAAQ